jgi:hypothetical protein
VAPYVFLTRPVLAHAGLPATAAVYSYHPVTLLVALAARGAGVDLRWPARAPLEDRDLAARHADARLLMAGAREAPPDEDMAAAFGPAISTAAITRKRGDIPLIVLPPTSTTGQ